MLNLKTLAQRFIGAISRAASERELDEELRFHLEMRIADNLAAGMTPAEAAANARRRFGDIERVKKLCREIDEDTAFRKGMRISLWLAVVCGATLWANRAVAQVNVFGEMLVVTAALCRLLLTLRATPLSNLGLEPSEPSLALDIEPAKRQAGTHPQSLKALHGREHSLKQGNRRGRLIAMSAVGTALCATSLCIIVFTLSARAFSAHLRQTQTGANSTLQPTVEKFVGTWTATVADMSGGKDAPVPPPFRDLPTDLLVAEVSLKLEGEKLTGTRVLYSYTKAADGSPVVAEKGELELTDIKFDGHVLSGGVTAPAGQKLPGGWEMKLTGENEAEVRLTNEEGSQQEQPPVKLHRSRK
jgi:hypothetical protein